MCHFEYGITNIEYTEFKRLGIRDEAQSEGSHLSVFPANTNVLYLSLQVGDMQHSLMRSRGGGDVNGSVALVSERLAQKCVILMCVLA